MSVKKANKIAKGFGVHNYVKLIVCNHKLLTFYQWGDICTPQMCSNSCPCGTSFRSAKLFGILSRKPHRNFINLCHEKRLQIAFGPNVRYSSQCVVHPCHIVFHWVTFWQKSSTSKSCLLCDCPPQSRFIKIPMWCS